MTRLAALAVLLATLAVRADEPTLVPKPDAFKALVNPNCSHCTDEAKRRPDLRPDDPVLLWTRGYSDGGAIPVRFFLAPHRVISDSYGTFVYDPDAGFARGFAPSFHFAFHGWRNGVMVMKDTRDDTLYSALTGVAFAGPKKGTRLPIVPSVMSTWGEVMDRYPNAVAYHMSDKYKPGEVPTAADPDSVKSRPAKTDPRLKADELVLGVRVGNTTKAYPLAKMHGGEWKVDSVGGERVLVFNGMTPLGSAAAYKPVAHQPRKFTAPRPDKDGVSPPDAGTPLPGGKELPPVVLKEFLENNGVLFDRDTNTAWDAAGRGVNGTLKGWTLEPLDAVVCKWFAWAAEYPDTLVDGEPKVDAIKEISGASEFLRLLPKPFATLKAVDAKARTVTLLIEGDAVPKVWAVEPDAEVKVRGWWGRLEQLVPGDRVWVWLKLNRNKQPVSVCMIADEMSEQDIHGDGVTVEKIDGDKVTVKTKKQPDRVLTAPAGFGAKAGDRVFLQTTSAKIIRGFATGDTALAQAREIQREVLARIWAADGLPGTVSVQHVFGGELEVQIDHEGMEWARALKAGDAVHIAADPPIKAVVKAVSPWRERTQLRLVVAELAAADLKAGERVFVKMPPPPVRGAYPADIGRPRSRDERIEWFLASIYCTCKVRGDICTGHFYTLASCNVNGCAAPNAARKQIGEMIDQKRTDAQIWDALLKERGPLMWKPHLLP